MATTTHLPKKRSGATAWPERRLWTVKEYYRAAGAGVFRPDERLELINGEVIRKVSPQGSRHATALGYLADALAVLFGRTSHVRQQLPLAVAFDTEPEPDVAVIRGRRRDYEDHHPGPSDVLLVVEVADKSLAFDRGTKAALYASAGIPEYWIVNLRQYTIEVHRDPEAGGYRTVSRCALGGSVSPLAAPNAGIAVADLLPGSRAR